MGDGDQGMQQNPPFGYQQPGGVPQGSGPTTSVQDQSQGGQGATTGINSLSAQERKLLREIMESKNKRDPRSSQRIKEILMKYPKIKEFIMTQSKAQQQAQPQ